MATGGGVERCGCTLMICVWVAGREVAKESECVRGTKERGGEGKQKGKREAMAVGEKESMRVRERERDRGERRGMEKEW